MEPRAKKENGDGKDQEYFQFQWEPPPFPAGAAGQGLVFQKDRSCTLPSALPPSPQSRWSSAILSRNRILELWKGA